MKVTVVMLGVFLCTAAKRLRTPRDSDLPDYMEWGSFENFGKTQSMDNVLLARPTNLQQVKDTIAYGRSHNLRVRAGGKSHSWSPLFSDDGHIVLFTRGIEGDGPRISVNEAKSEVTIMTGVNTGELKQFLLDNAITIRSNVILQVVEMGGVIGAICHGVGNTEQTVSDYVVQMRIVNSNGDLVTYDFRGEPRLPDKSKAIKGHLGLFGIVYDMTLAVEDEIIVEVTNTWDSVKEVFYDEGNLKKLLDENWSVELFWFPYNGMEDWQIADAITTGVLTDSTWFPKNDRVWGRVINPAIEHRKVDPPPEDNPFPIEYRTGFLARFTPFLLRAVTNILAWVYTPNETKIWPLMTAIHYQPASLMAQLVPSLDLEVAIDAGVDYKNVQTAVDDFKVLMVTYGKQGKFPVNIALEMRLVRNSDILLAPAQAGNPYTMYIEVLSVQKTSTWEEFLKDLAAKWTKIDGCRFHWAKQWRVLGGGIDNFVRKSYGANIERFKVQLERSGADPDHMFSNAMLDAILWPGTAALQNGTCSKSGCK